MNGEGLSVSQLAELAGVSGRTLRYYDQIGLLEPASRDSSGYRRYGQREIDLLQHILFYRELDIGLEDIRAMIHHPDFDRLDALRRHRDELSGRIRRLNRILRTVENTLLSEEKGEPMSDKAKFDGFVEKMINDNERQYGSEARQRWGDGAVDASNARLKKASKEDYAGFERISADVLEALGRAFDDGDPEGPEALRCAGLHRKFLEFWWDSYTPDAHLSMVDMYLADERFKAYYERVRPGATEFLHRAVKEYLKKTFDFGV
jgi:DNA-binding transcriptional MerR regulator